VIILNQWHCRIYIDELRKPALAEAYSDRVFTKRKQLLRGGADGLSPEVADDGQPPESIYLQLIQV